MGTPIGSGAHFSFWRCCRKAPHCSVSNQQSADDRMAMWERSLRAKRPVRTLKASRASSAPTSGTCSAIRISSCPAFVCWLVGMSHRGDGGLRGSAVLPSKRLSPRPPLPAGAPLRGKSHRIAPWPGRSRAVPLFLNIVHQRFRACASAPCAGAESGSGRPGIVWASGYPVPGQVARATTSFP